MKKKKRSQPVVIGWREWAAFPALGVQRIKAKMDTGAKTSAIHAFRVKTFEENGELYASFYLHPEQKKKRPEIDCTARVVDKRAIRSSNGVVEKRLIIRTPLRLGAHEYEIDLSLTRRDAMGFRLLLGRDALRKRFAIDSGKSFLLGKANFGRNPS